MEVITLKQNIRTRIHNLTAAQKKRMAGWFLFFFLGGSLYLALTCGYLYHDKAGEDTYWDDALAGDPELTKAAEDCGADAVRVTAGTYVENLSSMSFKENSFRLTFNLWFLWEGEPDLDMIHNFRIYKGTIHKIELLADEEKDGMIYQQARVDATISKDFWTVRFPLDSHQLRFYIEPLYPADRVLLAADTKNSMVIPNISVTGFDLTRHAVSVQTVRYESLRSDPTVTVPYTQELCTSLELNRVGFGLYFKCFIALFGTVIWMFITLYICTYHSVDPLRLIPAALFGAVTNIMVGANMLPDSMQTGLLEFVNIGGVLVILACTVSVVKVNRLRATEGEESAFLFGRTMFYTLLLLTITGNLLYPAVSYRF